MKHQTLTILFLSIHYHRFTSIHLISNIACFIKFLNDILFNNAFFINRSLLGWKSVYILGVNSWKFKRPFLSQIFFFTLRGKSPYLPLILFCQLQKAQFNVTKQLVLTTQTIFHKRISKTFTNKSCHAVQSLHNAWRSKVFLGSNFKHSCTVF